MKTVEIYYKPTCPYSKRALNLLHTKSDINLKEINVENNSEEKQIMIQRSNGLTTVPQIFINKEHIGGCDDLMKLENNGILNKKLYD